MSEKDAIDLLRRYSDAEKIGYRVRYNLRFYSVLLQYPGAVSVAGRELHSAVSGAIAAHQKNKGATRS